MFMIIQLVPLVNSVHTMLYPPTRDYRLHPSVFIMRAGGQLVLADLRIHSRNIAMQLRLAAVFLSDANICPLLLQVSADVSQNP